MDREEHPLDPPAGSPGVANRARWSMLVVATLVVVIDQLTKWWAVSELPSRDIDLFWTLRLNLTFNSGASFSLGGGQGRLIGLVVVVVAAAILFSGWNGATMPGALARGLIVGGAIGNLVDRVFRADDGLLSGRVVDFVDLQWFPVFNVADSAVVVGCVLLVVSLISADSGSTRSASAQNVS